MDLEALEKSLKEMVRRHEVLRTRIVSVDGRAGAGDRRRMGVEVEDCSWWWRKERERGSGAGVAGGGGAAV